MHPRGPDQREGEQDRDPVGTRARHRKHADERERAVTSRRPLAAPATSATAKAISSGSRILRIAPAPVARAVRLRERGRRAPEARAGGVEPHQHEQDRHGLAEPEVRARVVHGLAGQRVLRDHADDGEALDDVDRRDAAGRRHRSRARAATASLGCGDSNTGLLHAPALRVSPSCPARPVPWAPRLHRLCQVASSRPASASRTK